MNCVSTQSYFFFVGTLKAHMNSKYQSEGQIYNLRPSSDVVLLPCRTKLQFGSTVARQEIYSDSDVVPESNQIQGLLEPRNNSPPNSPRERNLARTY